MRSFVKVDLFVNNDDVILRPSFGLNRFGPESAVDYANPQATCTGGESPFYGIRPTGMKPIIFHLRPRAPERNGTLAVEIR